MMYATDRQIDVRRASYLMPPSKGLGIITSNDRKCIYSRNLLCYVNVRMEHLCFKEAYTVSCVFPKVDRCERSMHGLCFVY